MHNSKTLAACLTLLVLVSLCTATQYLESSSIFHKTFAQDSSSSNVNDDVLFHSISEYNYALNTTQLLRFFEKTKAKRDAKNFIPNYLGTIDDKKKQQFEASCFQELHVAALELNEQQRSATLFVNATRATGWTCTEWLLVVTRQSFHVKPLFLSGRHALTMNNLPFGEWEDIKQHGVHLFYFADGLLGTIIDVWGAFKILDGIYFMQNRLDFIKNELGIKIVPRKTKRIELNEKDVQDGDVFFRTTFDGPDVVLMYGTGGTIGHVLMALRFDGQLYIVESTDVGVIKTPWSKWITEQDEETQVVSIAKLRPDIRKKFDSKKAVEFFKSREGTRYGYQNIVFSWIDTLGGNYPKPLDAHIIPAFLTLVDALYHPIVQTLFIDGINNRLQHHYSVNANCTSIKCIFDLGDKLNVSIPQLIALVERDTWAYDNEHVMVCSAFLTQLFKTAGIFSKDIETTIEGNEFTPRDVYMLKIWDTDWQEQPEACKGEPYCQFIGKYEWKMPGFNTIVPYPYMNQKCSAFPPQYLREPADC